MQTSSSHDAPANEAPGGDDAPQFAADAVLLGSLVISVGIPLYHTYGITRQPILILAYVVSAILLPLVMPVVMWSLYWGRPPLNAIVSVLKAVFIVAAPALLGIIGVVYAGFDLVLTGVAIMIYVAAVLIVVAHPRLAGTRVRGRVLVARWAAIILTPLIVLGFTNGLPHGLDAIQGWAIPMPVMAAGAIGCSRALVRLASASRDDS